MICSESRSLGLLEVVETGGAQPRWIEGAGGDGNRQEGRESQRRGGTVGDNGQDLNTGGIL